MLANFHTHTTFCDGKNTPEEIILYAIDNGFDAIGFSGHGYTPFDFTYCMKDTEGYVANVTMLKEKYKGKIKIYLGIEEEKMHRINREAFDYMIGSSHYFCGNGKYYSIDNSYETFKECLEYFNNDELLLADTYYRTFCEYVEERKPDIVGHIDLITKYDETAEPIFLNNDKYYKIAEKYISKIADKFVFEINSGAISRGVRTTPYPDEKLLYVLKKNNGNMIISSDAHSMEALDFQFKEMKHILQDVGFNYVYVLTDEGFKKENL